MWVFTKRGFYSIVQDKDDEDYLIVRSRVKGDLESLRSDEANIADQIQETPDSDYRYRMRLPHEEVAFIIGCEVDDIDYTNYKSAVNTVDDRRGQYYGMIWAILADMQEQFLEDEKK